MKPYFESSDGNFILYCGDNIGILPMINSKAEMIFADPPYFLSGSGTTCKSGKRKSVKKGNWDSVRNITDIHDFNKNWIKACRRNLKTDGTIWVSGTCHNIYSVGMALLELDFKIINNITWLKKNPPPNLTCRVFAHSTETILWAKTGKKTKYTFNYQDMKIDNNGKQMKDIWVFSGPLKKEKMSGKHPTQKPLLLLNRIIESSTNINDLIIDPFCGSSTTGIAAYGVDRKYIGIDKEIEYLKLSKKRFMETYSGNK